MVVIRANGEGRGANFCTTVMMMLMMMMIMYNYVADPGWGAQRHQLAASTGEFKINIKYIS